VKKFFGVLTLAAAATSMQAGVTVPNGPWQSITGNTISGEKFVDPTDLNSNGTSSAYWNNATDDSLTECRNVGCFLTGADTNLSDNNDFHAALGASFWTNAAYLGNANGTAIADISFQAIPVQPAYMVTEVAGTGTTNWLGWYKQGVSSFTTLNQGTDWDVIFAGSDTTGASKPFSPSYDFGFWLLPNCTTCGGAGTATALNGGLATRRFTESSKNGAGAGAFQYFAVFAETAAAANAIPTTLVISVEDQSFVQGFGGADGDTNDLMFKMTVVPEPGYYVVLSLGLLALGVARRRMKTNVN
jgi:hypothetical protein